jgi:hypothetical protein
MHPLRRLAAKMVHLHRRLDRSKIKFSVPLILPPKIILLSS